MRCTCVHATHRTDALRPISIAIVLIATLLIAPTIAAQGSDYDMTLGVADESYGLGDTRSVAVTATVQSAGIVCLEGGTYVIVFAVNGTALEVTQDPFADAQETNATWRASPQRVEVQFSGLGAASQEGDPSATSTMAVQLTPRPRLGAFATGTVTATLEEVRCASGAPLASGTAQAATEIEFRFAPLPGASDPPEEIMPAPGAILVFALIALAGTWRAKR